ncbi:MAG: hypothetical protein FWF22_06945 [Treponema sp.]|nr:hypothetical protein [Treponema sp.]
MKKPGRPGSRQPAADQPEIKPVLERLAAALDNTDFTAIDEGLNSLDPIVPGSAISDDIEQIKNAILMMDYEKAKETIGRLLIRL